MKMEKWKQLTGISFLIGAAGLGIAFGTSFKHGISLATTALPLFVGYGAGIVAEKAYQHQNED